MAIASTTIHEVEFGGSDTANGGMFDPAGGTMASDLAATNGNTASPVVTSASYNFVAGDVGAWLFIRSGTNWAPGWYQIASVASNAATLSAAAGAGVLYSSSQPNGMSTAAGCATTASPTAGTWSIDYSQQTTAAFSLTGLTSAGTGLTVLCSTASKSWVGNGFVVTGGTNFNTGYYVITAVTTNTSFTVVGPTNVTTGVGASGAGAIGGAFASLGKVGAIAVAANNVFQKYSASVFPITSASTNVAGGCFAPAGSLGFVTGYATSRCVNNTDLSMPTNQAQGISTAVIIGGTSNVRNLVVDGQSLTSIQGFALSSGTFYHCVAKNCTNSGFRMSFSGATIALKCLAIGCTTQSAFTGGECLYCAAINCTSVVGFTGTGGFSFCVAVGCSIGLNLFGAYAHFNNVAYNNSSDGMAAANNNNAQVGNLISYGNGGKGINLSSRNYFSAYNCATGGNTGTNFDTTSFASNVGPITLTANPFVNPGATINTIEDVFAAYALNATAGGGAACRAAGIVSYSDIGALQHQDSGAGPTRQQLHGPSGLLVGG